MAAMPLQTSLSSDNFKKFKPLLCPPVAELQRLSRHVIRLNKRLLLRLIRLSVCFLFFVAFSFNATLIFNGKKKHLSVRPGSKRTQLQLRKLSSCHSGLDHWGLADLGRHPARVTSLDCQGVSVDCTGLSTRPVTATATDLSLGVHA